MTTYLGGPHGDVLRDIFEPSHTFAGAPISRDTALQPLRSNTDKCEIAARERANDAANQGLDETVQKNVYETTLKDCRAWLSKY